MTEMFGEAWSPMSVPDLAPDDDDDDPILVKGTCIFLASQIGRQEILRKLNYPACRLQPAISHP